MYDTLKNKIKEFEKQLNTEELKRQLEDLEQQRFNFVNKLFPVTKLSTMKIDDFVLGKGETFCKYIEYNLKSLGDIRGATAAKYGIYFGKRGLDNTKQYRINANLCSESDDYKTAFELIKKRIIKLIEEGENCNLTKIIKIEISPMVRGKILYLYFPEKYIPIYSESDIDYFLEKLNLNIDPKLNILEKQKKLIEWRDDNHITKNWTLLGFQKFLYYAFPKEKRAIKKANQVADMLLQEAIALGKLNANENVNLGKNTSENKKKKKLIKLNDVYIYPRDIRVARAALLKSNFKCQFDKSHECFIRKSDGQPYTEAHHLVPLSEHDNFEVNLDREENIVSLCCNCHAQIHKGKDNINLIKLLFKLKEQELIKAGIDVSEEDLIKMYKKI